MRIGSSNVVLITLLRVWRGNKFCEDFDMDDAFEKEHFDFKMKSMKVVNPITYVKGSL